MSAWASFPVAMWFLAARLRVGDDRHVYLQDEGWQRRQAGGQDRFAVMDFAFTAEGPTARLYSIGGASGLTQAVTSVERYDADSDSWTTLAALPEARVHAAAASRHGAGHILLIGGA